MSRRLEGLGVVLTRPRREAERLAAALAREGARTFVFPALRIDPLPMTPALREAIEAVPRAAFAIFVSANAVEHGLAAVRSLAAAWPPGVRVAAIGEATAAALRNSGLPAVISPPDRHDSDALLALPELQAVRGEAIIVFRGEGGRERLKDVLESRGARVGYAECYRRVRPDADAGFLVEAWRSGEVQAVSALSAETIANFLDMLGGSAEAMASSTTLFVPHDAIASSGPARRFAHVRVAPAEAEGLAEALSSLRVHP
jgi:uroporphyrinogen-III synthase